MIEFKVGEILAEDVDALVNTVNCVGVMGRGIALQFKDAFPGNYHAYRSACERDQVRLGSMFVFETGRLTNPRYIINFPTKHHWRGKSRIEDIETGLTALRNVIRVREIRSIAIPPLGSGLGGLNWNDVRPRIESALQDLDALRVVVFEPRSVPERIPRPKRPSTLRMTPGRAALVGLMDRYLGGLLDPFVTLLEVHKLMYFMKVGGEPALQKLRIVRGVYGPYAENLKHALREVEGHFIHGFRNGGDVPNMRIELVPGAVKNAKRFLDGHPYTHARFDRVVDLITGFESPFGLELLSTVHWVMTQESLDDHDRLVSSVYDWNDRKRQFSIRQIKLAAQILETKGWTQSGAFRTVGDRARTSPC